MKRMSVVAEYLKCYGYAGGKYRSNCDTCKKEFTGGKRSITCKTCATEMALAGVVTLLTDKG